MSDGLSPENRFRRPTYGLNGHNGESSAANTAWLAASAAWWAFAPLWMIHAQERFFAAIRVQHRRHLAGDTASRNSHLRHLPRRVPVRGTMNCGLDPAFTRRQRLLTASVRRLVPVRINRRQAHSIPNEFHLNFSALALDLVPVVAILWPSLGRRIGR